MIQVFKQNGSRHALLISSNAYIDNDFEVIKQQALANYVVSAYKDNIYTADNVLLFWHGGDPIGDIVDAEMVGPFLIEIAKERADAPIDLRRADSESEPFPTNIRAVWDMLETAPLEWGASIGFKYRRGDKQAGVYDAIIKYETSVLPLEYAANDLTGVQPL